jgi:hypothetical protein
VAGADVAEGLEHGDYSVLTVLDAEASPRPVQVLTLRGHWPPDVFAAKIAAVAALYPGLYGIERNNHGLATILECRRLRMRGLHHEQPVVSPEGVELEPGKPGWNTTAAKKTMMIDQLEQALRLFQIELRDPGMLDELRIYRTHPDGKTGAPSGRCDDRVIALAIAIQMLKHLPPRMPAVLTSDGLATLAATRW